MPETLEQLTSAELRRPPRRLRERSRPRPSASPASICAARSPRLERELGELFASTFPRQGFEWSIGAAGGPRVLATRRARARSRCARRPPRATPAPSSRARADVEEANRGLLERMIAAPESHRWVIVSNEDVGEPGLPPLALAPALGHPRDAARLVAHPALLGLSVSRGASAPGRQSPATADGKKRRKPRPRRPAAPQPATAPRRRPATAEPSRAPRRARSTTSARRRPGARSRWSRSSSLVALVMLVAGFFVEGSRGTALLVTGLALGSLAGLELSIREHFAGYRSHTTLLAGAAGVATLSASPSLRRPAPSGQRRDRGRGRGRSRMAAGARLPRRAGSLGEAALSVATLSGWDPCGCASCWPARRALP